MNSDALVLVVGLVCLIVGAIVGWGLTYSWLLRNSASDPDYEEGREWYV